MLNLFLLKVFIEPDDAEGEVTLATRDPQPMRATLRIASAPVQFRELHNTGLLIPFKSSRLITTANLSFAASFDVPLAYAVVDGAEFGLVECLRQLPTAALEEFQLCSTFSQLDLEKFRVRYRHTSENRPLKDLFAFRVSAIGFYSSPRTLLKVFYGAQQSDLLEFVINFFPTSVRVYSQEPLTLNNTEQLLIGRAHLTAVCYPEPVAPDDIVYHIVEPPKYGMISRQVGAGRMRRIGLASNFTQRHVDENTLVYKLNYVQFAVLNDFFMYRVLTPTTTTELLRADLTYIPGGSALQLINRTVIVNEGRTQKVGEGNESIRTPCRSPTTRCGWRRRTRRRSCSRCWCRPPRADWCC